MADLTIKGNVMCGRIRLFVVGTLHRSVCTLSLVPKFFVTCPLWKRRLLEMFEQHVRRFGRPKASYQDRLSFIKDASTSRRVLLYSSACQ